MPHIRRLLPLLKIAFAGGVLAWLVSSGRLSLSGIVMSRQSVGWLAAGFSFFLVATILGSFRWYYLLAALGHPVRWFSVFRINCVGLFCNTFMPGGFGGDLIRLVMVAHENGSRTASAATILYERVNGMMGLLIVGGGSVLLLTDCISATPELQVGAVTIFALLGGVALSLIAGIAAVIWGRVVPLVFLLLLFGGQAFFLRTHDLSAGMSPFYELHLAGIGGMVCACAAVLIIPSLLPGRTCARLVLTYMPLGPHIMAFVDKLLAFRTRGGVVILTLLLSTVLQACCIVGMGCFAHAIGHPAQTRQLALASPLAFIANIMPLFPGGLGIGEAVFDSLLRLFRTPLGQPLVNGATIFLGWRVLQSIVGVVLGLPLYIMNRREINQIREEEAPAGDEAAETAAVAD